MRSPPSTIPESAIAQESGDAPELRTGVLDYAQVSADDVQLGRQLRLAVGGGLILYGGSCTIAAAIRYAAWMGLVSVSYGADPVTPHRAASDAVALIAAISGGLLIRRSRGVVRFGATIARACSVAMCSFYILYAISYFLYTFHPQSQPLGLWYWIAIDAGQVAYCVIWALFWYLLRGPAYRRIIESTTA